MIKHSTDFHHILTIDSDHTEALNNLCWCMSLVGRAAEGLPYCERALSIKPDYTTWRMTVERWPTPCWATTRRRWRTSIGSLIGWTPSRVDTYNTYGPRRERWVESLSKGENPFDEAELLALRKE